MTADTIWNTDRTDESKPIEKKDKPRSIKPRYPPKIGPKSGSENKTKIPTAGRLPAIRIKSIQVRNRNFATTKSNSLTPYASNNSKVPFRYSSEKHRIVIIGVKNKSKIHILWNPLTISTADTKTVLKLKKNPVSNQ